VLTNRCAAWKSTPTAGAVTTLRGIRVVLTRSLITGGSTTELSATDAWHRAVVGDAPDISIITQDCQSATVHTGQIHWGSAVLTDAEYLDTLIRAALTATKALLPKKVTSQEDAEPAA
jgi:hypothetical protein